MKPCHIIWKDAGSVDAWQSLEDAKKDTVHEIHSLGFLLHETEEAVTLCLNWDQTAENVSLTVIIPRNWIISLRILRVKLLQQKKADEKSE